VIFEPRREPQFTRISPAFLPRQLDDILQSLAACDTGGKEHDPEIDRAQGTGDDVENSDPAIGAHFGEHERIQRRAIRRVRRVDGQLANLERAAHCYQASRNSKEPVPKPIDTNSQTQDQSRMCAKTTKVSNCRRTFVGVETSTVTPQAQDPKNGAAG